MQSYLSSLHHIGCQQAILKYAHVPREYLLSELIIGNQRQYQTRDFTALLVEENITTHRSALATARASMARSLSADRMRSSNATTVCKTPKFLRLSQTVFSTTALLVGSCVDYRYKPLFQSCTIETHLEERSQTLTAVLGSAGLIASSSKLLALLWEQNERSPGGSSVDFPKRKPAWFQRICLFRSLARSGSCCRVQAVGN